MFAFGLMGNVTLFAQSAPDSTRVLPEITVEAFHYRKPLNEVPAAVGVLRTSDLSRFSPTSWVPVLNTLPGVQMEERSPGSYRLAIRGSSLRSPFGIRNVKVYWNELPFTDPGGNTYLNLFDFSAIDAAEVIKGPGSSLYGAGTGGVVLLRTQAPAHTAATFSSTVGSYGLLRYGTTLSSVSEGTSAQVAYHHQQSDGYRDQSAMTRDALQALLDFRANDKQTLSVNVLYSDLFYQTPGGLTLTQYDENPRQARPAAGATPGAVAQQATVYNKTFYTGVSHNMQWNESWSNRTGLYGTFTQFANPAIRNYEQRLEPSFGGRTNTTYAFRKGKLNFGAEYQRGLSAVKVYANTQGVRGALQTDDEVVSTTYFGFAQAEWFLPADFFLTTGVSINKLKVGFTRVGVASSGGDREFATVVSPRVALLKRLGPSMSVYGSFSQGYSPPSIQELYPSTGVFDQQLNPERGDNVEVGFRGQIKKTLDITLTAYHFALRETIVNRRDESLPGDPEYFINAGHTRQQGVEAQLTWTPARLASFVQAPRFWISYTYNDYTFRDYEKSGISYSGNILTGTTPVVAVAGVDVTFIQHLYLNATATFHDHTPLNDANTDMASAYTLLSARIGYRAASSGRWPLDIFAGADNLLDERYSLGNDLNAAAGRYYNAAPGRNFYAGVRFGWTKPR